VQYGFTSIALTGSLGANNAIVVLPNVQQRYEFDLSGLTSSTGTLQFKNAGGAVCTSPAVGAAIANSLAVVVTNVTAVNKIACNY
jgi:hypothetical protein